MGKDYVMFLNEKIFEKKQNPFVIGIIFENEYCIYDENKKNELQCLLENYKEGTSDEKNINDLLKDIDFKILVSKSKSSYDYSSQYELCIKDLLRDFNEFIVKENGSSGKIIFEDRKNIREAKVIQEFFDIYHMCKEIKIINKSFIENVNTFIVCEKNDKKYKNAFKICSIISSVVNKYYNEIDDIDNIFNNKVFIDKNINYLGNEKAINELNKGELLTQIKELKNEIDVKDLSIKNSKLIINNLKKEIENLKEAMENSKRASRNFFEESSVKKTQYSKI